MLRPSRFKIEKHDGSDSIELGSSTIGTYVTLDVQPTSTVTRLARSTGGGLTETLKQIWLDLRQLVDERVIQCLAVWQSIIYSFHMWFWEKSYSYLYLVLPAAIPTKQSQVENTDRTMELTVPMRLCVFQTGLMTKSGKRHRHTVLPDSM